MGEQVVTGAAQVTRVEEGGRDVSFSVTCSKGTYVRALAHDLVRCPSCSVPLRTAVAMARSPCMSTIDYGFNRLDCGA